MKKIIRLLLGFVTLLPIAYMGLFVCVIFDFHSNFHSGSGPIDMNFAMIFSWHLTYAAVSILLMFYYVIHLFRTDRIKPEHKALWGVTLFGGMILALPFYWYWNIWKEPRSVESTFRQPMQKRPIS